MNRETILKKAIDKLNKLPDSKVEQVSDFIEFLLHKTEEFKLQQGILKLVSDSDSFAFLEEEEDLYTVEDLKEKYK